MSVGHTKCVISSPPSIRLFLNNSMASPGDKASGERGDARDQDQSQRLGTITTLAHFLSPLEAGAKDAQKRCRRFIGNVKLTREFICGPLIRLALDFKSVARGASRAAGALRL